MHRTSLRRLASALAPVITALACALQLSPAFAQQSSAPAPPTQPAAPRDIPTPEQLEPGVNTTPSAADMPAGTSASPATSPAPAAGTPGAQAPAPAQSRTATPPSRSAVPTAPADTTARKDAAPGSAGRKGPDRLQLDATEITGNRELPKVLYIVPWKRSDLGDLMGRPVNSLLDEVLQPLDRDVFQRENRYYNGLKPPAAPSQGGTPQGAESKP
jgi:hypothetical protein